MLPRMKETPRTAIPRASDSLGQGEKIHVSSLVASLALSQDFLPERVPFGGYYSVSTLA